MSQEGYLGIVKDRMLRDLCVHECMNASGYQR